MSHFTQRRVRHLNQNLSTCSYLFSTNFTRGMHIMFMSVPEPGRLSDCAVTSALLSTWRHQYRYVCSNWCIISPLGRVYRMIYVQPLLLMDGSLVCYEQLRAWCNWISCDWICRLVPLFSVRWGNCFNFRQKFDGALIRRRVATKRLNVRKRENILSKEGQCPTLQWKIRVSLPIFFRKRGGLAVQVSSNSVARFTIYRSPDGAAGTERTQRCYGECRNSSRIVITDFARMW